MATTRKSTRSTPKTPARKASASKKTARSAGRPPGSSVKIDPKKVALHASRGLNKEQIAAQLGIGRSKFFEELAANEALRDAFEEGKQKGIGTIVNVLFQKAKTGSYRHMKLWLQKNDPEWNIPERKHLAGHNGGPLPAEKQFFDPDDYQRAEAELDDYLS